MRKLNVTDGQTDGRTDGRGALQYLPSRAFGAAGDNIHFCEVSSIIERNRGVLFIYEGRLPFLEDDGKFDSRT